MFKIPIWDIKEPTHYLKRVGHDVPSVVAVLLSSKMWPAWRDVSKKACGVIVIGKNYTIVIIIIQLPARCI